MINWLQKQIIENYIRAYNSFDIKGMIIDLDDKVVFENIADGIMNLKTDGLLEFKDQAQSAVDYFKERTQKITSWDFNDDKVIVGIDYTAILATDLPGGMNTDETIRLKGRSEFIFKNKKIIKIRDIS